MFQQVIRGRAFSASMALACAAGAAYSTAVKSNQLDASIALAESKKPKLVYFNTTGRAVCLVMQIQCFQSVQPSQTDAP